MRFAGAAGSEPLAALPQLSSAPGRLAGGKVGEKPWGRSGGEQRAAPVPAEAAAPISAQRDAQSSQSEPREGFTLGCPCWDGSGRCQVCPSVFQIPPQAVWLRQGFHEGKECGFQSRAFPRAEHPCGISQGRGCCAQGLSVMQPHISLFPVSQICFKSCDETELQNPLYEHPN